MSLKKQVLILSFTAQFCLKQLINAIFEIPLLPKSLLFWYNLKKEYSRFSFVISKQSFEVARLQFWLSEKFQMHAMSQEL